MDEVLLDRVKAFVARQLSVRSDKLTLATRIREDIGCDGDDGEEFLLAFSKEFGVDLAGLRIEQYFNAEYMMACSPLAFFERLSGRRPPGDERGL